DAGKTTVYLPNGIWVVEGRLILRGSVQRFIGCEAEFEGNGSMEIADGESGTVVFERFMKGYGSNFKIKINNSRTTILSSCILGHVDSIGSGDVFIDDICGDSFRFSNQKVWARQWNSEPPVTKITNDGGTVWILGLKTEREGTLIHTLNGGKTELLGGFCYATSHEKIEPMFVSVDSDVCYVIGESSFNDWPFMILVRETRGKETKELKKGNAPGRTGGSMIPLFTGYSNSEKETRLDSSSSDNPKSFSL
ncbi:MAG: endopolygalacturonase, partial [bacterium]|nr:endopolygalacturonase [bacterium]